ncbi:hypothetical protein [Leptospira dzoumogneensis]|uniref:Uncharacterized protein n=1 Tax=Leptospira dzoumogneensis TaxID=2484904 RepID=A0A4Z1AEW8_9LEPT|nr:hypothetical protein [Leptospira dzoumogneensis]TGM95205.1 hypothetical protein EHR06_19055 [Leptospira dzoumogneensis]
MLRIYKIFIIFISLFHIRCGYFHYQAYLEDYLSGNPTESFNSDFLGILLAVEPSSLTNKNAEDYLEVSQTQLNVIEGGNGSSYDIRLKIEPTQSVYLDISPENRMQINGSANTVRIEFTPQNWDQFQTISVNALDNSNVEGTVSAFITHSISSADVAFSNISTYSLRVDISDNDSAEIFISKTTSNGAEGGATGQYNISLTGQPISDVIVTLTPNNQIQVNGSSSPIDLTFTNSNWTQAQTVTISAIDDSVVEGPHNGLVTHSIVSDDLRYSNFTLSDHTFKISDNDPPTNYSQLSIQSTNVTAFTMGGQGNYWVGNPGQTIPFTLSFQITSSCNVNCSVPFLVGIYSSSRLGTTPDSRACQQYSDIGPYPKNIGFNNSLKSPSEPGIYMITLYRNTHGQCSSMITDYSTQGFYIGVLEVIGN